MANYQKLIKYARTYTRRAFLKTGLSGVAGLTLMTNFSGCQSLDLAAINQPLAPTPNCDDGDHEPTQRDAEGPFYTPDTPERSLFVGDDDPGTRLLVTGRVLNTQCQPIAGALLDFWHTDDAGNYDNEGFNFRGHQFADAEGNYHLETVLPGLYPERPIRHIHVKAQAPNGPILTTQMYFEGESGNEPAGLIMAMTDREDGTKVATFDFILDYAVAQAPTDLDQEVIKEPVSEEHKIYFPLINRG